MENWIKEILQVETRILPFDKIDDFSFYFQSNYAISYLELDGRKNLLLTSKNHPFSINAILKEIDLCTRIIEIPVVFSYTHLSHYQRNLLLRNHVPFIIKGNAVSLPFLGQYLSDKAKHSEKRIKETFSPVAQYVFLYLFYLSLPEISFKQLSIDMKINKMAVSRAIDELKAMKIIEVESTGRAKKVMIRGSRAALLESALPFLNNPIIKLVYATSLPVNERFIEAGTKALSADSMLDENKNIVAISLKQYQHLRKSYQFMSESSGTSGEFKIEIWKYDPLLFAHDNKADIISLYLSLQDNQDERVRNEIDTLWRVNNGKWV